jgi:hypothetical protein
MLQSEWDDWVQSHSRIFGFNDANILMLDAWRFVLGNNTVEELRTATKTLAGGNHPSFPKEHLGAITGVLRERRAVEYRREFEDVERQGTCETCGSSGFVSVPHLKGIVNGEWRAVRATRHRSSYYTQTVLCTCALGKWKRDRLGKTKSGEMRVMMELNAYAMNNPRWREQMAEHSRRLLANASAMRTPAETAEWRRDVERLMASIGDQGDAYEGR